MYSLGGLPSPTTSSSTALRAAFLASVALAPIVMITTSEIACGVPDSFNNLVGGPPLDAAADGSSSEASGDLKPDPTLPPPRPVVPISFAWVNGSKVKFKWELAPGTIGARVEVCRTRACDGPPDQKKTFDGGGSEVLSPDLEPGVWFWRLYSKTAETIGTTPSPAPWEVLVRGGPNPTGGAGGSIVDINGDGKPDLLVTLRGPSDADGGVFSDLFPYLGAPDSDTSFDFFINGFSFGAPVTSSATEAEVAVIDINGDGFSDVVANIDFNTTSFGINAYPGEAKGLNTTVMGRVDTIPFRELPTLREMGDIDGDGYGDVLIGTRREVVIVHGTPKMLGSTEFLLQFNASMFPPDAGFVVPPAAVPVGGGFQRNGDIYQDVVFYWPFPPEPPDMLRTNVGFLLGGPNDTGEILPWPMGDYTGVRHFASGDFDGDGLSDTAFVTTSTAGKTTICAILASATKAQELPCFTPPDPIPTGFASSLTTGDLDADGRDEIVVGSTSTGIDVLRLNVNGGSGFAATHLATELGAKVTTIFPGRPGPAIWAATRASGAEIAIFKGDEQKATLKPPQGTTGFGPLIR